MIKADLRINSARSLFFLVQQTDSWFMPSCIKTETFCANSGEQCSDACKYNQSLCNEFDSRNTIERKIDLLLGTLNTDISSSEWRKEKITPSLVVDQQVRNARANKCILKAIRELLVDGEPFVFGWIGSETLGI
ncbi:hypothetical protein G6F42_023763 [Rhizopus arrhizus]|nr:hypothetical protein G6F42_023763 [Rhizopus arrhizus]